MAEDLHPDPVQVFGIDLEQPGLAGTGIFLYRYRYSRLADVCSQHRAGLSAETGGKILRAGVGHLRGLLVVPAQPVIAIGIVGGSQVVLEACQLEGGQGRERIARVAGLQQPQGFRVRLLRRGQHSVLIEKLQPLDIHLQQSGGIGIIQMEEQQVLKQQRRVVGQGKSVRRADLPAGKALRRSEKAQIADLERLRRQGDPGFAALEKIQRAVRQKVIERRPQATSNRISALEHGAEILNLQFLQQFTLFQREVEFPEHLAAKRLQVPSGNVLRLVIQQGSAFGKAPAVARVIVPIELCQHAVQDRGGGLGRVLQVLPGARDRLQALGFLIGTDIAQHRR